MRNISIDFAGVETKAQLYDLIEEKLGTPAYFSRNLDALHDVLSEMQVSLELCSFGKLRKTLGGYAAVLEDMLAAVLEESDNLSVSIKE